MPRILIHGRTLLHFEGAGQSSEIYAGAQLVSEHNGGYDEFVVDITEACRGITEVPLAVLCDNGRDIERMPSDLSDFTLYGGIYRHVSLVYVPPVSVEAVHTEVAFEPGKTATVNIGARLYAPEVKSGSLHLDISLYDPQGSLIHRESIERMTWQGEEQLAHFEIAKAELWSPHAPNLYRCDVTLTANDGDSTVSHRFGVRHAVVRFSVAGDGKLIDNLGTPGGSRVIQMYNGRAEISIRRNGPIAVSVISKDVETGQLVS